MKSLLTALSLCLGLACGGGGPDPATAQDPWAAVAAAVTAAQGQFPEGLYLEVATPAGVVYSRGAGGFSNTDPVWVASASKWVTSTVLLQLVDQGFLGLDTRTKELLSDRSGNPWSGNLGEATLRHLLGFTSGLRGDVPDSENYSITLDEAVKRIYDDQQSVAFAPGTCFYYSSTHMRVAGRMAEVATGKSWSQIFEEQMRAPMGLSAESIYSGGSPNPKLAGGLKCTGLEYMRFLVMQLRKGLDGSRRVLSESLVAVQREDGYGPGTSILYSPYRLVLGKDYHYALGNWLETLEGGGPSGSDPVTRHSSTGAFGWAPWVAADGSYAALIMTQQPGDGTIVPSEALKGQLDPLIRAALALAPPVLRER